MLDRRKTDGGSRGGHRDAPANAAAAGGRSAGFWAHGGLSERRNRTTCGSVLLKPLPNGAGEIEIGWHLHPDSWGRGLATEAAGALLRYGFELGLTEIWAVTHLTTPARPGSARRSAFASSE